MMKLKIAILCLLAVVAESSTFHRDALFGVCRGGGGRMSSSSSSSKQQHLDETSKHMTAKDVQNAQRAIFHAAERAEQTLQHAIEQEVATLFQDNNKNIKNGSSSSSSKHDNDKNQVKIKAQKAVAQAAKKVKQKVKDHASSADISVQDLHLPFEGDYPYPYDLPSILAREHKEHRILHAIESAEKAVLHAVQDEVTTLFHELEEHHQDQAMSKKTKTAAKTAVTRGVKTSHQRVMEASDKRRQENDFSFIQEYIEASTFD